MTVFSDHLAEWMLTLITFGLVLVGYYQLKTTRAQLRAHIVVDAGGIIPFVEGQSVAHYTIRNVGYRPASNVQWWTNADFSSDGHRRKFDIDWKEVKGKLVLAPGGSSERALKFGSTKSQIENFVNKSWLIYVWGEVRYKDGFHKRRWIRFCHRYGLGLGVVIPLEKTDEIPPNRARSHQHGGNDTDDA